MTAREERAMQLEMHKMTRMQNDVATKNAALDAECMRLRLALKRESEKCAASHAAMVQQFHAEFDKERERLAAGKHQLEQDRQHMAHRMQKDAVAQRQANMDELGVMKRGLDARCAEMMNAKTKELDTVRRQLEDERERIQRNEQEQLVQFLGRMEEAAQLKTRLEEEREQVRCNEQEFKRRIEAEKNEFMQSMEHRFEDHVQKHTAGIKKMLMLSEVSHAIAANYAHTQLIHRLDFSGKRVAIYSHYSERDEVESYNILTLECIEHYFDYIIILTNCPHKWNLSYPDYNKFHLLAYNLKSDFRNYGLFIMQTAATLKHAARLCFMNDSFVVVDVGAFGSSIKHLFEPDGEPHDFAGLTSSHECVFHLQSYFMCFNAPTVGDIVSYFEMQGLPANHQAAISQYELGITGHLMNKGHSQPFAVVSNNDMRIPLNTTCCKWATVLQNIGIIKRQHFFKKYPYKTAMTDTNIAVVADKYSYNKHFMHFLRYHGIMTE
jgi:hypothetical protein